LTVAFMRFISKCVTPSTSQAESQLLCVCVCACVRACMRACVRACVCLRVCARAALAETCSQKSLTRLVKFPKKNQVRMCIKVAIVFDKITSCAGIILVHLTCILILLPVHLSML
jgi:hypothetical protein